MPTREKQNGKGAGDCVSPRPMLRVLSSWKNLIYFMVGNEWGRLMATDIDEKLLDEILTDLEKAGSWTPAR